MNKQWGRWYLDEKEPIALCLKYNDGKEVYDINLLVCQTLKQRNDWVDQIADKTAFIEPMDVIDLMLAFKELEENGYLKEKAYS